MGRRLYPKLDLWTTAKPFMERWVTGQFGPWAVVERVQGNIGPVTEQTLDWPLTAHRLLTRLERETRPLALPVRRLAVAPGGR